MKVTFESDAEKEVFVGNEELKNELTDVLTRMGVDILTFDVEDTDLS